MFLLLLLAASAGIATALPHAKKAPSYSIGFTQQPVNNLAIRSTRHTIAKRQQNQTAGDDDISELANNNNVRYLAAVQLGGQTLDLILDTGSTDTFVYGVQPDSYQGQDSANLPPLFDNSTAQGVTYLDLLYNASYGSGSVSTLGAIAQGPLQLNGTDLSAANLTFANLYQSNAGTGGSGLLGLGFPLGSAIFTTVLQAFNDTGNPLSVAQAQALYPLVPLLEQQGEIQSSLFSLVVDRVPGNLVAPTNRAAFNYTYSNGTLTIGDYPEGYQESDFTFSPVATVGVDSGPQAIGVPPTAGYRWTTAIGTIYFNGQALTNTTQAPDIQDDDDLYFALIDSGNPAMQLPPDMMAQITDAYAANSDNATIPCDSEIELVIEIAGTNFTLAKEDLLIPSYQVSDPEGIRGFAYSDCQFNAQPSAPTGDEQGPYTSITYAFGDVFLRNVAMVFDYGNINNPGAAQSPRMGFAQR